MQKHTIGRTLGSIYMANFLWTFASAMLFTTLTVYHETVLNLTKGQLSAMQGYSVFAMQLTKLFSGVIVDIFHNYKGVLVFGSIITIFAKAFFGYVTTPAAIGLMRGLERITKGLRAAPTDSLISLTQGRAHSGIAFALKQASLNFGAVIGAIFTAWLLWYSNNDYSLIYYLTAVPVTIALFCIMIGVKYEKGTIPPKKKVLSFGALAHMPAILWWLYLLVFFVAMGRIAESYLGNRFYEAGYPIWSLPLTYLGYYLPYFVVSLYAARLYDYVSWYKLFLLSTFLLMCSNLLLALSQNIYLLVSGTICYGLHMGIMQGLFLTIISKKSPDHIKGTVYAFFYIVFAFGLLVSNALTGYLGSIHNTWRAGFLGGATVSFLILVHLPMLRNMFNKHD